MAEEKLGEKAVDSFLAEIDPRKSEVSTLLALAAFYHRHQKDDKALEMLQLVVQKSPGNLGAHRLRGEILLAQEENDQALKAYGQLLEQINGEWVSYQCQQCGFITHNLSWKCARCLSWDTIFPRPPVV